MTSSPEQDSLVVPALWEGPTRSRFGTYIAWHEQREFRRALALADPPSDALEIGAEGGRWTMALRQRGWRITCTDIDPAALAICQQRVPEARCIVVEPGDTRFPVDAARYRLLVVMEVPPVSEAAWFPSEAARVLQPGGILIVTLFNFFSARGSFYRMIRRRGLRRFDLYTGPSYSVFRRALRAHGFQIVAERGLTWFPFSRTSNNPLIPLADSLEQVLGLSKLPTLSPLVIVTARKAEHTSSAESK